MNRIEEIKAKCENTIKIKAEEGFGEIYFDIRYLLSEVDRLNKQIEAFQGADAYAEYARDEIERLTAELEQLKARANALESIVHGKCAYCDKIYCTRDDELGIISPSKTHFCMCNDFQYWQFDQARFSAEQPESYQEK